MRGGGRRRTTHPAPPRTRDPPVVNEAEETQGLHLRHSAGGGDARTPTLYALILRADCLVCPSSIIVYKYIYIYILLVGGEEHDVLLVLSIVAIWTSHHPPTPDSSASLPPGRWIILLVIRISWSSSSCPSVLLSKKGGALAIFFLALPGKLSRPQLQSSSSSPCDCPRLTLSSSTRVGFSPFTL